MYMTFGDKSFPDILCTPLNMENSNCDYSSPEPRPRDLLDYEAYLFGQIVVKNAGIWWYLHWKTY